MGKTLYKTWQEADHLAMLQGWAHDGLTDEQIAHNIGIRRTTLYDWKKRYPDIADALKHGKEVSDYESKTTLLQT
ncbi:helix-turn-helix domain-containing protein [Lacticaseibacillus pantheris]|uniref:helix-turn-helix domain-containing protein n=1 Tax=Lacticaseibacillus pantheris TaxID=171523 RepID=UPI0012E168F5|nr:helix-turn-helix domain-containing protein [Lacticaseibacillus pantheris]